jgi:hypothetical protein
MASGMFAAHYIMLSDTTLYSIQANDCAIYGMTAFSWNVPYMEILDFIVVDWTSSD